MFLVTGATGNVGGELLRALAESGRKVRALSRSGRISGLPAEVEVAHGDLDRPGSLRAALTGVRAVFLLPGHRDMPGVLAEIRNAGADRVVLLSGGSAGDGDPDNVVSASMARSERAVTESGLPATILRPYGFMSNTLDWAPQLRVGDVVRAPFADVPIAMIDPFDIAAVAAIALSTDEHVGSVRYLSGPEPLRPADRVRLLGEALGRPLRFQPQSNADARAEMEAAMPAAYVDAFFRFYVDGTLDESQVLPTVPEIIGRPARTFTQWAHAHAAAFRQG